MDLSSLYKALQGDSYKSCQLFRGAVVLDSSDRNFLRLPESGDVALGINTTFGIFTGKSPGHQTLQANLCRGIHQPQLVQKLYYLGYAVQEGRLQKRWARVRREKSLHRFRQMWVNQGFQFFPSGIVLENKVRKEFAVHAVGGQAFRAKGLHQFLAQGIAIPVKFMHAGIGV